jgi:SAM-dependent methyltransferase
MEEINWWYRARRDLLSGLLIKCARRFDSTLDAGCGTGSNYDVLRRFSDRVYGLDMSDAALQYCSGKGYAKCFNATVREFKSEQEFDLIMLMDVIEHIDDDLAALKNMAGMLRSDGLMVVSVPAYDILWNSNDYFSHHKRRYTPRRFRSSIEGSGLKVLRMFGWNRMLFLPTLLYYRIFGPGEMKNNLEAIPSFMNGILYALLKTENFLLSDRNVFPGVSLVAVCGNPAC